MSNVIPTPEYAKNISKSTLIDGQSTTSVKVAVVSPEDIYAVEIKPLLDYYYNALHMQIHYLHIHPFAAFQNGYILLNGAQYEKEHFPKYQRLIDYKLATSINESLFQTIDLTLVYLRNQLHNIGMIEEDRVPNITGYFSAKNPIGDPKMWTNVFSKSSGSFRLEDEFPLQSLIESSKGSTGHQKIHFYAGADSSIDVYGRFNRFIKNYYEAAPSSVGTLAFAFVGTYAGPTPERKTYWLINQSKKTSNEHTITLANNYGYNSKYMTDTPPPSKEMHKWIWNNEQWIRNMK